MAKETNLLMLASVNGEQTLILLIRVSLHSPKAIWFQMACHRIQFNGRTEKKKSLSRSLMLLAHFRAMSQSQSQS